MQIVLTGVINSDQTKYVDDANGYYIMGGGTAMPNGHTPGDGFNVRELGIKATEAPAGTEPAGKFIFPGGLVLIDSTGQSGPLSGKRITITIDEVTP